LKAKRDPFGAVADPTRRAILELLLKDGPLPAGQIAARFPKVSRPAVSKHLRVLRDAKLVRAQEVGREWHYTLDMEPLFETYQRWIAPFLPGWEMGLQELKRQVEKADD
jgi:DNA-binding transcriptional ArsR family regulator